MTLRAHQNNILRQRLLGGLEGIQVSSRHEGSKDTRVLRLTHFSLPTTFYQIDISIHHNDTIMTNVRYTIKFSFIIVETKRE